MVSRKMIENGFVRAKLLDIERRQPRTYKPRAKQILIDEEFVALCDGFDDMRPFGDEHKIEEI